jgi:hypothetical protein
VIQSKDGKKFGIQLIFVLIYLGRQKFFMKIPETRLSAKSGFLGHQKIRKMSIFLEKSRKMAYLPVITRKLPEGVFLIQLVFGRDILLPIKFKANWAEIKARRQNEIRRNNE